MPLTPKNKSTAAAESNKNFVIGVLLVFIVASGLYASIDTTPVYTGAFKWTRVIIKGPAQEQDFASKVFKSADTSEPLFILETGDECFYLGEKHWISYDSKDPGIAVTPVFCPAKGGGWALPRSE